MVDDAQEMCGRYRILGQLAVGGMAEVLLGRLSGPSGFERPVVIKRILPHYASRSSFRNMFLDEARLAAGIHHPNVVQHLELGEEQESLYLVMEYLSGEPLSGVQLRAHARGARIPPALAAHIVSEACAGLHAAHEHRDPSGVPQRIVHRDVSPQNLFITFDGSVKVIDFGIAKAAHRITTTEAGTIKGKFEYMSPEQVRADVLDRRSDIFSAGIVLHELLTGRRLFKRRTSAGSLRAIVAGEIPRPSAVAPECPPALDEVCMRALALEPKDRFQDALSMRRALVQATATAWGTHLPEEALAAWMHELFPDRIEEKQTLLNRVRDHAELGPIPSTVSDTSVELPEIYALGAHRKAKRRRRVSIGGLATVLVAAAVGGAIALGRGADRSPSPASHPPETASPPAEASAPPPTAAPAPPPPTNVEIHVTSDPPATLFISGERQGTTPVSLRYPHAEEPLSAELRAEGHVSASFEIVPDRNHSLRMVLAPTVEEVPETPEPSADDEAETPEPSRRRRAHRVRRPVSTPPPL